MSLHPSLHDWLMLAVRQGEGVLHCTYFLFGWVKKHTLHEFRGCVEHGWRMIIADLSRVTGTLGFNGNVPASKIK